MQHNEFPNYIFYENHNFQIMTKLHQQFSLKDYPTNGYAVLICPQRHVKAGFSRL